MESNIIAFYALTFVLFGSAVGLIFFPKMYMSLISFFCFVLSSCFLYWELNAKYLSVFQFILCGVILCGYLFLLLKNADFQGLGVQIVYKRPFLPRFRSLTQGKEKAPNR